MFAGSAEGGDGFAVQRSETGTTVVWQRAWAGEGAAGTTRWITPDQTPQAPAVPVQTASSADVPETPPLESAAATPAEGGGPAPTPVSAGHRPAASMSATELDEMARRLYEPLSARLRAELWLDRERYGLVTDRHR